MTYQLSPEQSQLYDLGGYDALHVIETVYEDLVRLGVQACLIVLDDGSVAEALDLGEVW